MRKFRTLKDAEKKMRTGDRIVAEDKFYTKNGDPVLSKCFWILTPEKWWGKIKNNPTPCFYEWCKGPCKLVWDIDGSVFADPHLWEDADWVKSTVGSWIRKMVDATKSVLGDDVRDRDFRITGCSRVKAESEKKSGAIVPRHFRVSLHIVINNKDLVAAGLPAMAALCKEIHTLSGLGGWDNIYSRGRQMRSAFCTKMRVDRGEAGKGPVQSFSPPLEPLELDGAPKLLRSELERRRFFFESSICGPRISCAKHQHHSDACPDAELKDLEVSKKLMRRLDMPRYKECSAQLSADAADTRLPCIEFPHAVTLRGRDHHSRAAAHQQKHPGSFVVAYQTSINGAQCGLAFDSFPLFLECVGGLTEERRRFQSYLGEAPHCLVFDVDVHAPEQVSTLRPTEVLQDALLDLTTFLGKYYGVVCEHEDDMLVAAACRDGEVISYHIHMHRYKIEGSSDFRQLKANLKKARLRNIDTNIYRRNGTLRCLRSVKMGPAGARRPLVPRGGTVGTFVLAVAEDALYYPRNPDAVASAQRLVPEITVDLPAISRSGESEALPGNVRSFILAALRSDFGDTDSVPVNDVWVYNKNYDNWTVAFTTPSGRRRCPHHGMRSENGDEMITDEWSNNFAVIISSNGILSYYCHSERCPNRPKQFGPKNEYGHLVRAPIPFFKVRADTVYNGADAEGELHRRCKPFLELDEVAANFTAAVIHEEDTGFAARRAARQTLAIREGLGAGKTFQVLELAKRRMADAARRGVDYRIAFLVHRRSLGADMTRRCKERDLIAREDSAAQGDAGAGGEAYGIDRELEIKLTELDAVYDRDFANDTFGREAMAIASFLVIQVDSFFKLKNAGSYDMLIVDESESNLMQVVNTIFPADCWAALVKHAKMARTLIVMDGTLDVLTMEFLELLGRPAMKHQGKSHWPALLRENTMPLHEGREYVFETDTGEALRDMKALLSAGKNIFVVSASKTTIIALQDELIREGFVGKDDILLIHSEMTKKDEAVKERVLANLSKHIAEYRVCLTSPTITAGCSIDAPHFHHVFALVETYSVSPAGMWQMMHRVRNIIDNKVTIVLGRSVPIDASGGYRPSRNYVKAMARLPGKQRQHTKRTQRPTRCAGDIFSSCRGEGMTNKTRFWDVAAIVEHTMACTQRDMFHFLFRAALKATGKEPVLQGLSLPGEEDDAQPNAIEKMKVDIDRVTNEQKEFALSVANAPDIDGHEHAKLRERRHHQEILSGAEQAQLEKYELKMVYGDGFEPSQEFVLKYRYGAGSWRDPVRGKILLEGEKTPTKVDWNRRGQFRNINEMWKAKQEAERTGLPLEDVFQQRQVPSVNEAPLLLEGSKRERLWMKPLAFLFYQQMLVSVGFDDAFDRSHRQMPDDDAMDAALQIFSQIFRRLRNRRTERWEGIDFKCIKDLERGQRLRNAAQEEEKPKTRLKFNNKLTSAMSKPMRSMLGICIVPMDINMLRRPVYAIAGVHDVTVSGGGRQPGGHNRDKTSRERLWQITPEQLRGSGGNSPDVRWVDSPLPVDRSLAVIPAGRGDIRESFPPLRPRTLFGCRNATAVAGPPLRRRAKKEKGEVCATRAYCV